MIIKVKKLECSTSQVFLLLLITHPFSHLSWDGKMVQYANCIHSKVYNSTYEYIQLSNVALLKVIIEKCMTEQIVISASVTYWRVEYKTRISYALYKYKKVIILSLAISCNPQPQLPQSLRIIHFDLHNIIYFPCAAERESYFESVASFTSVILKLNHLFDV